jgi:hypothetical protein
MDKGGGGQYKKNSCNGKPKVEEEYYFWSEK